MSCIKSCSHFWLSRSIHQNNMEMCFLFLNITYDRGGVNVKSCLIKLRKKKDLFLCLNIYTNKRTFIILYWYSFSFYFHHSLVCFVNVCHFKYNKCVVKKKNIMHNKKCLDIYVKQLNRALTNYLSSILGRKKEICQYIDIEKYFKFFFYII